PRHSKKYLFASCSLFFRGSHCSRTESMRPAPVAAGLNLCRPGKVSRTLNGTSSADARRDTESASRETIAAIMESMTAGKFRHVPVVEDGQLVGIVSIGDVVKHRLHEIEHESAALRDYIQTA